MRIFVTILLLIHGPVLSLTATEYRSLDGTGNDLNDPLDGAAGQPIPRISYGAEYPGEVQRKILQYNVQRGGQGNVF